MSLAHKFPDTPPLHLAQPSELHIGQQVYLVRDGSAPTLTRYTERHHADQCRGSCHVYIEAPPQPAPTEAPKEPT